MKLTTLALMLLTFAANAQQDSVYIVKQKDDMKGIAYYTPNRAMGIINIETKQSIKIQPYLNNDGSIKTLYVKTSNIGTCNEKNELILLLENEYRVISKSWKSFNCDGESYFNITEKDLQMLRISPVYKIRFTNGRSYESYTDNIPDKNKRYFIQLLKSIESH